MPTKNDVANLWKKKFKEDFGDRTGRNIPEELERGDNAQKTSLEMKVGSPKLLIFDDIKKRYLENCDKIMFRRRPGEFSASRRYIFEKLKKNGSKTTLHFETE